LKSVLLELTNDEIPESYYKLIFHRYISEIDEAIDEYYKSSKTVEDDLSIKEKIEKHYLENLNDNEDILSKMDELTDMIREIPATKDQLPKESEDKYPPGTKWGELGFKFVDEDNEIEICLNGKYIESKYYEDMGFKYKGHPDYCVDEAWKLLLKLKNGKGVYEVPGPVPPNIRSTKKT